MACRIITLGEEQVESKSWKEIYNQVESEEKADAIFDFMLKPEFMEVYGENWTKTEIEPIVTDKGIQKLDGGFIPLDDFKPSSVNGLASKLKTFVEQHGISIQVIKNIEEVVGDKNPNAVVNFFDMTLQLVEGKVDDNILAEEAAHVYTKWIQQENPSLYNAMAKEAVKYEEYNEVKDEYQYETEEDYIFETIGKIIGNRIITKSKKADIFLNVWWNNVKKWLKSKLNLSTESFRDVFDIGAFDVLTNKNTGVIRDRKGKFFSLGASVSNTIQKLIDTNEVLEKRMKRDNEGALREEYFHKILNKFVTRRVTTDVKKEQNYSKKFTDKEKAINDKKAEFGTKAHAALENIVNRFKAMSKGEPLPAKYTGIESGIYTSLENYMYNLLKLPEFKDSVVLSEIQIYNPRLDRAGTLDLVIIDKDGVAHVLDFKFITKKQERISPAKRKEWNSQIEKYRNDLNQEYGIKKFGMLRMLPFEVEYTENGDVKSVGIDANKIFDNSVIATKEVTNNKELDTLLEKLYKTYSEVKSNKRVSFTEKADRLSTIENAINSIKLKKDITDFKRYLNNELNTIERDLNNDEISYERAEEMYHLAEYYSDIHTKLGMVDELLMEATRAAKLKIEFRKFLEKWADSKNLHTSQGLRKVEGGLYSVTNLASISNPVFGYLSKLLNWADNQKQNSLNKFLKIIEPLNITEGDLIEKKNNKYQLISQFKGEFFDTIKTADTKWIKDNTVVKDEIIIHGIKYNAKEHFEEELKRKTEYFKEVSPDTWVEKIEEYRKFNDFWSNEYKNMAIMRYTGSNIYVEPSEAWYTDKYKALVANKESDNYKFYEAVQDLINTAKQYTNGERITKNLLPFIEKSMITKLFSDGINVRLAAKHFIDSVVIRPEDTVEERRNLSIRYLSELPEDRQSTDLKKVFTLFAESVYDVKYKTDIEAESYLGKVLLENSKFIQTDTFGNPTLDESGEVLTNNTESSVKPTVEKYEDFVDFLLYDIKNKKDLALSTSDGTKQISGAGLLSKAINYNALLRIGFKALSIGANLFGGNANIVIEASKGKFFSLGNLSKAKSLLYGRDAKSYALIDYFDTFTENTVYKKAERVSTDKLDKLFDSQWIMKGQEFTEKEVQNSITLAYLDAHTIKEGKIVKKAEGDKSIIELTELKDGKVILPDISERDYNKVRNVVGDIAFRTTGSRRGNDRMLYQAHIGWRAIAQFKSFILPLGKERFGGLSYNQNSDMYEEGRYAQMFKVLLNASTVGETLKGIFTLNAEARKSGIEKALMLRYETYLKLNPNFNPDINPETGLTFEAYKEVYQQNVRAMIAEIALFASMTGLALANSSSDDDDNKKLIARVLDRFTNELSYFYSISSVFELGGTSIPLLNTAKDTWDFLKEIAVNSYAIAADEPELLSPEKVRKKAGKIFIGLHQIDNFDKLFNNTVK
jgi:hypothetical protein